MNRLLVILLLLSSFGHAQNYRCFDPQATAFYKYTVPFSAQDQKYLSIRIDSSVIINSDTVHYNYCTFNNDPLWNNCMGLDIHDTNRLFGKAIFRNGWNIFIAGTGDSVQVNTQGGLNSNWNLVQYGDGSYIRATVSSIALQNVLGSPDSVKHISLQKFDVNNFPVSCVMNGAQIQLGKNSGLVFFYPFTDFANDTTCFRLAGRSPSTGVTNLTATRVFDFSIGDTMQYNGGYNALQNGSHDYDEEKSVIGKTVSTNNDTITYTFDHIRFDSWWTYNPNPSNTTAFVHDTVTAAFIISQLNDYASLPNEFVIGPQNFYGYYWQHLDGNYNGRMQKSLYKSYYSIGPDTCVQDLVGWCIFPVINYADGLGFVTSIDGTSSTCGGDSMIFYHKGNETWGNRLNWSVILGEPELNKADIITAGPNPLERELYIELENAPAQPVPFIFCDITGKEIFRSMIPAGKMEFSISLPELSRGTYLLSLQFPSGRSVLKLIK